MSVNNLKASEGKRIPSTSDRSLKHRIKVKVWRKSINPIIRSTLRVKLPLTVEKRKRLPLKGRESVEEEIETLEGKIDIRNEIFTD